MPARSKPPYPRKAPRRKYLIPFGKLSRMELRPLERNYYRTKIFGLNWLARLSKTAGIKVLPFKVFESPKDFSIKQFSNPAEGRFIIRTDPSRKDFTQSMEEWVKMPRLNFYLAGKEPEYSERFIRRWMSIVKRRFPDSIFIAHKVRNLRDYEMSVQLNVDIARGEIIISTSRAETDKFRDESNKATGKLEINENGKIRRVVGERIVLSDLLQRNAIRMSETLMSIGPKVGCDALETSFVTYKDKPDEPEYYDLVFGKRI